MPIQAIEYIRSVQPERQIILCGRTWSQLDAVEDQTGITVFFSVGSDEELALIWNRIDKMEHPAISIHKRYLTEVNVRRFKEKNTTIVTWPVNTFAEAKRLHELGVDGFTTDNPELVKWIAKDRERALEREDPPVQQRRRRWF